MSLLSGAHEVKAEDLSIPCRLFPKKGIISF